ncbi:unnamed protein product [Boreogadus saida]
MRASARDLQRGALAEKCSFHSRCFLALQCDVTGPAHHVPPSPTSSQPHPQKWVCSVHAASECSSAGCDWLVRPVPSTPVPSTYRKERGRGCGGGSAAKPPTAC